MGIKRFGKKGKGGVYHKAEIQSKPEKTKACHEPAIIRN
jgi:hypothetical protein